MSAYLRILVFVLAAAATAGSLRAQTPAAPVAPGAPKAPVVASPAPPADPLPSPPPNFIYAEDGRRDPFVDLLNRGTDSRGATTPGGKRPEGAAGLQVGEVTVRGIVKSRGAWTAMIAGPDGKVYTLRAGDRLLDGSVREVTARAVVILQEVKDPLSLDKQREVRKFLRGGEEVK